MFGSIGFWEVLVLIGLAFLLFGFGARRLPAIGRGLGEGIRNFREALRGSEKGASDEQKGGPPSSADGS
jgi:sec-independent protein translocase protein TatA